MSLSNEAGTRGVNAEGGNSSAQSYSSLDAKLKDKMPSGEGTFATPSENRQSYSTLDKEGTGNDTNAAPSSGNAFAGQEASHGNTQSYSAADEGKASGGVMGKVKDAFTHKE